MATKPATEVVISEKMEVGNTRKSLPPLWKKLTVIGVTLAVIVALSVGLGLGLTQGKGGNDGHETSNTESDDSTEPYLKARGSLWQPKVGTTWQIILLKPLKLNKDGTAKNLKPNVGIYDLDLYDNDAETFKALHKAGKKVICYFSAGSWENWRDDKNQFKKADLGKTMDGWPDEKWINLRSKNVRNIMKKRIKYAADKGCDAIDPDNVDGYVGHHYHQLTHRI
jgi:hypothetical protein